MTEQEKLPPKTCEIDRLVTGAADIEKIISGQKRAVRRNGRYADPGEIMVLHNHSFKVDKVYRQTLGDLTDEMAQDEGYPTLEEYKNAILSIHKGMPWVPNMKVWVHEFSPVGE
ncbi:ASCH domain-containing protein [Anaerobacillus alkaliphilus]|uniref:ASCH domain-containing protein n=1 Tax=Anaerobacillus alkaliphilus TaxID=1548597 RepID=A0A4Q0VMV3_9BACI|nr:ASCH domain-containing protein [Anaerobacillus alkaliphilus]RXI96681.1 ASCH domain-containing protein [Anaerobacillus alkaliphilus]